VQNAYTLAFGGLLLLGARAGDILGRRRMFVAGLALFTAASPAIGPAPSAAWLLAARAVQGIGAAVLAPSMLALLTATFPEGRERTRAVAYYGAVAASGPAWDRCSVASSPAGCPGASASPDVPAAARRP
jgi:MFS family permease